MKQVRWMTSSRCWEETAQEKARKQKGKGAEPNQRFEFAGFDVFVPTRARGSETSRVVDEDVDRHAFESGGQGFAAPIFCLVDSSHHGGKGTQVDRADKVYIKYTAPI